MDELVGCAAAAGEPAPVFNMLAWPGKAAPRTCERDTRQSRDAHRYAAGRHAPEKSSNRLRPLLSSPCLPSSMRWAGITICLRIMSANASMAPLGSLRAERGGGGGGRRGRKKCLAPSSMAAAAAAPTWGNDGSDALLPPHPAPLTPGRWRPWCGCTPPRGATRPPQSGRTSWLQYRG